MKYLTRQQLQEIDRRAREEFGLPTLVLMENAGRGCADLLCKLGIGGRVVVCCGRGNNGGDGLVIARHLDLRGHDVRVLLWGDPEKLSGDVAANYAVVAKSGISLRELDSNCLAGEMEAEFAEADWIVDALLGTGSQGEPRPPLDRVIGIANRSQARKLAVDLPSGLECDSGQCAAATFRANHTATFVAPKVGFLTASARDVLGQVHVLDIGAPRCLVEEVLAKGKEAE